MLKIDQEALRLAQNNYSDYASQMRELRDKLKKSTDDLKSVWKSEGGKVFFEKFEDEWIKNINNYINVINHMSNNMLIAQNRYQAIFEEADKLNLR